MSIDSSYDTDHPTRRLAADVTTVFAGVMLLVTAAFDVLQGISAIARDDLYASGQNYVYSFDTTGWGWVHVGLGVIGVGVAIGILSRAGWAQVGGILVAGLVMLTNFAFLPYYPFWSFLVIAFSGLVIWALCTQLKYNE